MLKQKTKVIEAGGAKYRLGKMDARSASYLANESSGGDRAGSFYCQGHE